MAILKWKLEASNISTETTVIPDDGSDSPITVTSTALLTTTLIPTITSPTTGTDQGTLVGDNNTNDVEDESSLTATSSNNSALIASVVPEENTITALVQESTFPQTASTTDLHTPIGFDGPHSTTAGSTPSQGSTQTVLSTSQGFATPSGIPNPSIVSDQHESSQGNLVPVIASVVPFIVILVALLLCFWRRRRKESHDQQLGDSKQDRRTSNSTLTKNEKIEDQFDPANNLNKIAVECTVPSHDQKKHRPIMIQVPTERNTPKSGNRTADLEDPFLTPTDQTAFSSIREERSNFHTSQIGLALTTPPGLNHNHERNASTTSLPSSILTVLHHATQRLSNPFRDPVEPIHRQLPTKQINSSKSVSPVIEEGHIQPPTKDQTSTDAPTQPKQDNGLAKSDTPPEELARRWIEVLKLEAAQAQEAAEEAARAAKELKSKHQREDKHKKSDGDDNDESNDEHKDGSVRT